MLDKSDKKIKLDQVKSEMRKIKRECMIAFGVKKKKKIRKPENELSQFSKENTLRDLNQMISESKSQEPKLVDPVPIKDMFIDADDTERNEIETESAVKSAQ